MCFFGEKAASLYPELKSLLKDSHSYVKSRAVVALAKVKQVEPVALMKEALLAAKTGAESLLILNDVTYLQDTGLGYHFTLEPADVPQKCSGVDWRLKYLKSK